MRSLDDGIFMHPNQDSITFGSRINNDRLIFPVNSIRAWLAELHIK